MVPDINSFNQLPLTERLLLVEDLWDSIARNHAIDVPIPDWQKKELTRRKQKYGNNPDAVVPWPDVKRPILESEDR